MEREGTSMYRLLERTGSNFSLAAFDRLIIDILSQKSCPEPSRSSSRGHLRVVGGSGSEKN